MMTNSTILDYSGSMQRMGNDPQLFDEMLGFFREDAPAWLRRLHQALANNDLPAVRFAAHSLKGQAANFGAERAVQAATVVETAARELRPVELPAAVHDLDAAFTDLLMAADELYRQHNAGTKQNGFSSVVRTKAR